MNKKPTIVIIDTASARGEDLAKEWSARVGHLVVYYGTGEFILFESGASQRVLKSSEVCATQPVLCLFHASNRSVYTSSEHLKSVVDSCKTVVLFSGVGILRGDPRLSEGWFSIPRAISGWGSATDGEWRQFANWLTARLSESVVPDKPVLLSVKKESHFLRALLILCQGFLAAERMPARVPASAVAQTRKREWWRVPLLNSAGSNLEGVVEQEWGDNLPGSLQKLVEWIACKTEIDDVTLTEVVGAAKTELECKITK